MSSQVDDNYAYSRVPSERSDPVVSFSNADSAWRTDIISDRDETFNVGYREDADLGAFLARPVKIAEIKWSVGQALVQSFNPWELFLQNPNVLRRIENFFLLRGDLELEFMINGNGFYYGRALVSYSPLKKFRLFDLSPATNELFRMQASQRPHLFLDPTTSTGGEMSIPYFWSKNWINLTQADYKQLGEISIIDLASLNQANSGSGAVNIVVFASMKNVMLTMPTVNPVDSVSPQSGVDDVSDIETVRPKKFKSTAEREAWIIEEAVRRTEETERRSRVCKDPIAIIAAGLACLSAAGFAREINALRARARELEKSFQDTEKLTDDITSLAVQGDLQDVEFGEIKPESGKGKSTKKSGTNTTGSSKSSDEYGDGIISKPASILAKAAGAITNVPVIGKYALASKYALEGVSNIARIFGYSRPPIINNIMPVKHVPAGYMAYTDMDEAVAKLSLDTKQELSIDPSTVGIAGTDQMSLAHVLRKESYFTQFGWREGATPETVLFSANITPHYFSEAGLWGGDPAAQAVMTPMTHVSQLFQHWRGSITFRFQIVASNFHKGRIRVTWDPYSTGLFNNSEYNVAYNRVIDLAENRDFEITVNWGQAEAWRRIRGISGLQTTDVYRSNATLVPIAECTNGMLQISVVNKLTTPNDTIPADVDVLCYVRAGDDFELANPSDGAINTLSFNPPPGSRRLEEIKPESGEVNCAEETDTGMSDEQDNSPEVSSPINPVGGEMISPTDNTLYVFMGEKVASLRQLMKRYCWHDALQFGLTNSNLSYTKQFIINFPVQRGYSPSARTSVNGQGFNFTHMTYMNYIVPCYAAWRGGIRRKYQFIGLNDRATYGVARDSNSIVGSGQTKIARDLTGLTDSELAYDFGVFGENARGGAYTTDGVVNPNIECEFPFYSEYRFAHTHIDNSVATLTRYPEGQHHAVEALQQGLSGVQSSLCRTSVAIGEDFSCFWYLNVPVVYSYDAPPI
jgi:hypothetical protein